MATAKSSIVSYMDRYLIKNQSVYGENLSNVRENEKLSCAIRFV